MITIDCPLCAGDASTDEAITVMTCEACGISASIAPDPVDILEAVA
jgi:hypothetical protein